MQISITLRWKTEVAISELVANNTFCVSDIFNKAEAANFVDRYFRCQNLWF
jgi:hypothetical protein